LALAPLVGARMRPASRAATLVRMDAIATAVSGMRAAQSRLDAAAHNIANSLTPGFRRDLVRSNALPEGGVRTEVQKAVQPGSELAADLVEQKQAALLFAANGRTVQTGVDILGRLLDTRA
jgi:flagellar basal-body rod protein FlgC